MGKEMTRFLERFSQGVEVVAGLLLGVATLVVVASVVGRYLFSWPIPDAFDFSRLLIAACIMWGFAAVGYRGSHIKVDLFAEMMGPRLKQKVNMFAWTMLLVFVVLFTWKFYERVGSALRSNESTFDLRIAVWPAMALIWLGVAVSVVTVIARLWLIATGQGTLENSEEAEKGDPHVDG